MARPTEGRRGAGRRATFCTRWGRCEGGTDNVLCETRWTRRDARAEWTEKRQTLVFWIWRRFDEGGLCEMYQWMARIVWPAARYLMILAKVTLHKFINAYVINIGCCKSCRWVTLSQPYSSSRYMQAKFKYFYWNIQLTKLGFCFMTCIRRLNGFGFNNNSMEVGHGPMNKCYVCYFGSHLLQSVTE